MVAAVLTVGFWVTGMQPTGALAAGEPIAVQANISQMFVDDFLIQSQSDLKCVLHQPTKDDGGNVPVLALDKEFHGGPSTLEANGGIVYDPQRKKFVMIALGDGSEPQNPGGPPMSPADHVRLYRFTSTDAMHWIKGDDGSPQRLSVDMYDPVSRTSARNTDLFSFFYDTHDPTYPYKGWLCYAHWGEDRSGIYYVYSSDGVRWQHGKLIMGAGVRKIEQDGRQLSGVGDVTTFYHDPLTDRFLALIKFYSLQKIPPGNALLRVHTCSRIGWMSRLI